MVIDSFIYLWKKKNYTSKLINICVFNFYRSFNMMCQDQIVKSKRCGKYSFRLIGKMKTYFKGTVTVDFKPIQKT